MLVSEQVVESSHVVRDLTAKLRQDRGIATSNLVAICGLEASGGRLDLWRWCNCSESPLAAHGRPGVVGGAAASALDPDVEQAGPCALMELGWTARDEGRSDEMLVWLERADPVLEGLVERPQNLEVIVSIDQSRRAIAGLFARRGLEEPRRTVLESHIRMLERLSERAGSDPAIGLLAAMARADLASDDSVGAAIRAAMARLPANGRFPKRLETRLATWIARDLQPYPSDSKPTGKLQGRLDPDLHGRAVIRALESSCADLAVYPALLPAAAVEAIRN